MSFTSNLPLKSTRSVASRTIVRRSREQTTQKLFNAALKTFAKYGYDATTTKMIAKNAGVNETLICRYFKNKLGLLRAVILEFIKNTKLEAMNYEPGANIEEEIRNLLRYRLNRAQDRRDQLQIVVSRMAIDPKLRSDLKEAIAVDPDPVLLTRLAKLQKEGELAADVDLTLLAYELSFEALGLMFWTTIIPSSNQEIAYQAIDSFAKNFSRGVRG